MAKMLKVSNETHNELIKLGRKNETFDDIIKRLLLLASSKGVKPKE